MDLFRHVVGCRSAKWFAFGCVIDGRMQSTNFESQAEKNELFEEGEEFKETVYVLVPSVTSPD